MSEAEDRRRTIESKWEEWRLRYEATNNPVYCWLVYRESRNFRLGDLPDWVSAYLDRAANGILMTDFRWRQSKEAGDVQPDVKGYQAQVLDALGFTGGDQQVAVAREGLATHVAGRVRVLHEDGLAVTYAQQEVATYYTLPESTIRQYWHDYRAIVEAIPLDRLRDTYRDEDRERHFIEKGCWPE